MLKLYFQLGNFALSFETLRIRRFLNHFLFHLVEMLVLNLFLCIYDPPLLLHSDNLRLIFGFLPVVL